MAGPLYAEHVEQPDTPSPFSDFPTEIIISIFQQGSSHSLQFARTLTLVCRWTLPIGLQAIYRTVVLPSPRMFLKFLAALSDAKYAHSGPSAIGSGLEGLKEQAQSYLYELGLLGHGANDAPETEHFSHLVRARAPLITALWCDPPLKYKQFLDQCLNVENLAIPAWCLRYFLDEDATARYDSSDSDASDRETPPPQSYCRRLTIITDTYRYDWDPFTRSRQGQAFLAGLTQLSILSMHASRYIPLQYLINVTHLAVPSHVDYNIKKGKSTTLDQYLLLPSLKMLVILMENNQSQGDVESAHETLFWFTEHLRGKDQRLYVLPLEKWEHTLTLWEEGARGQLSLWDKAYLFREHRGQIRFHISGERTRKLLSSSQFFHMPRY